MGHYIKIAAGSYSTANGYNTSDKQSLTASNTVVLPITGPTDTFTSNHNSKGAIFYFYCNANYDRSVTFRFYVGGVLQDTQVRTAAQIFQGNGSWTNGGRDSGIYFVYVIWTTPIAVTTGQTFSYSISDSGGTTGTVAMAIDSTSRPLYVEVTDTTSNAPTTAANDVWLPYDTTYSGTVSTPTSTYMMTGTTIEFADGLTLTPYTTLLGGRFLFAGANVFVKAGSAGAPCSSLVFDYSAITNSTVNFFAGYPQTAFDGTRDSKIAVRFYGTPPTTERAVLTSSISVGATSFTTDSDVSAWLNGQEVFFINRATRTSITAEKYILNGAPVALGGGSYTVNFTPTLANYGVDSGSIHKGYCCQLDGYGIKWKTSSVLTRGINLGLQRPMELVFEGASFGNGVSVNSIADTTNPLGGDARFNLGYRLKHCASLGEMPFPPNQFAPHPNGCEISDCHAQMGVFGTVGLKDYSGDGVATLNNLYGGFKSSHWSSIGTGVVFSNLYLFNNSNQFTQASLQIGTPSSRGVTGTNVRIKGSSSSYGAVGFAGIDTVVTDLYIDDSTYAIDVLPSGLASNITINGFQNGQQTANDYTFNYELGAFLGLKFNAPTGAFTFGSYTGYGQSNIIAGSSILTTNYNSTANDYRAWTKTGKFLSNGTTAMDQQYIGAALVNFWDYRVSTEAVSTVKIGASIGCQIANAAFYAGVHVQPSFKVTYDGASTVTASAAASTAAQTLQVIFTPTTDGTELKATISGVTDALTNNTVTWGALNFNLRKYGKVFRSVPAVITHVSADIAVNLPTPAANAFITQSNSATVAGYTGITINDGAKTCVISGSRTFNELYDYSQYDRTLDANMFSPEWLTTLDGVTFTVDPAWTVTVTGSLTSTTQRLATKPTVASGGYFLDTDGARRDISGTTYYASPVTFTFKDGATAKQYVEAAVYDSGGVNRTYDSSFSAVTSLTSDVSGVVNGFVVYRIGATTYTGHALKARLYGYLTYTAPKTVTGATLNTTEQLTSDAFTVLSRSAVSALTGFALDYSGKTVTTSSDHTLRERYDRIRWSDALAANLAQPDTISTADGVTYIYPTTWSDVVSARLTDETRATTYTSGSLTISGSGFYEDKNGARWKVAGSDYYASHYYGNVVDAGTSSAIPGVAVFVRDGTTGAHLLYSTALVEAPLVTDSSGNVEGYVVYRVASTSYADIKQVFGEYSYLFAVLPRSLSGLPVGSSSSREVTRMSADAQVTGTKAAALALSGPAVSHSGKSFDLADLTLAQDYDWLKARQAGNVTLDGLHGLESYLQYGQIVSKSGTLFSGLSDWLYTHPGSGGTLQTGTLALDLAETFSVTLGALTLRFTQAGTYDLRASSISGSLTLTATASPVTLRVQPSVTIVPGYPGTITVDASLAVSINLSGQIAGTRVEVTVAGSTVYNNVPSGPIVLSRTYTVDESVRVRAMQCGATSATKFVEFIDTLRSTGLARTIQQEDDPVYRLNGINGSAVTGIIIDDAAMLIEIAAGDLTTMGGVQVIVVRAQRLYAYETYWLSTAVGIEDQQRVITAIDAANYAFSAFKLKNISSYPVVIVDGYVRDAATNTSAALIDYSGGPIFFAPDHVVIVSVGGANVITGDLADVPAAVWTAASRTLTSGAAPSATANAAAVRAELESTTIPVDVQRVRGGPLRGVGSEADPWGPA